MLNVLISGAAARLAAAGVDEPRREASLLLEYAIRRDRTFVIAHSEYEPTAAELQTFHDFVRRRCGHEPFHYIVGRKEFYGLNFVVRPGVLIPRPETEMLVTAAINELQQHVSPAFCELGVGSGCISSAILFNVRAARCVGLEVSPDALAVARENADLLGVAERCDLRISDRFAALDDEKFDLIVSNPPYVAAADIPTLQPEVREHEPHTALTDGGDGLSFIRYLAEQAYQYLRPGGLLLIEFGVGQSDAVESIFNDSGWRLQIEADMRHIPRMAAARRAAG